MVTCPLCRRQYGENAHYCKYDGALLINNFEKLFPPSAYPGLRSCGRCLAYYPGHFIFCPIHGSPLNARSVAADVESSQETHSPASQSTSELRTPRPTNPCGPPDGERQEMAAPQDTQSTGEASSNNLPQEDELTVPAKRISPSSGRPSSRRLTLDPLAHFIYSSADTASSDRNRLFFVSCAVVVLVTALLVYSQFSTKPKEKVSQTPPSPPVAEESAKSNPPPSEKAGPEKPRRTGVSPSKTPRKPQPSTRTNRKLRTSPRR